MRQLIARMAACGLLLSSPAIASFGGTPTMTFSGDDESIGSLPTPATGIRNAAAPPEESDRKTKVKPDESECNLDGVCVENDVSSTGDAYLTPKDGGAGSETKVTTKSGFVGSVKGLDWNDTATLGSSQDAEVEGSGGTVKVGGGSQVKVTCTTGPDAVGIKVELSSGVTATVPPGSTVTFST